MGLLNKKKTKVQLAPGEYVEVDNEIIKSVNQQKKSNDLGLYSITAVSYTHLTLPTKA